VCTYAPVCAIVAAIVFLVAMAMGPPVAKPLTGVPGARVPGCQAAAAICSGVMHTRFSIRRAPAGGFALDLAANRSLAKHRALVEWALPWPGFARVVVLTTGRFASHTNSVAKMCVDKTRYFAPLQDAATVRGCQAAGVCSTLSLYGPVATQFLAEWAVANSPTCCTCRTVLSASETRVPPS
jgi:hypothetical protein